MQRSKIQISTNQLSGDLKTSNTIAGKLSLETSRMKQRRNDGVAAASSDGGALVVGGPDSSRVLSD